MLRVVSLLFVLGALCLADLRDPLAEFPPTYRDIMRDAINAFHEKDFGQTIRLLDRADLLLAPTPISINTRGAVAIETKDFAEGARLCHEALKQDPAFFPARFNLGEIPFVQGKYAEARGIYQKLLEEDPRNELVQYRILLTYLLEKNYDEAERLLASMRFPSDTAAYYYAHAAREFAHGNEEKALGWIKSGDWVFPRKLNLYFSDVLREIGWLKRE